MRELSAKECLFVKKKEYSINTDTYRPRVESDRPEEMYDNRSEYEIRVLDGELFFILEKKKN